MKVIHELCSVEFAYVQFLEPLCKHLCKEGYNVHTSYTKENNKISRAKNTIGCKYVEINCQRSINPTKLAKSFKSIRSAIYEVNADIIHMHTPLLSYISRLILIPKKARGKVRIVYTVHGFMFHKKGKTIPNMVHFCIEWVLSLVCDKLLFVSKADYTLAVRLFPGYKDKFTYIGNGVDTEVFTRRKQDGEMKRFREENKFNKEDFTVGFVGRYVKEKGILELIEASLVLKKNYIKNLRLMIIGALLESDYDRTAFDAIKKYEKQHKDLILNVGYVTDKNTLSKYYNLMDVFCLPSHREGMPTSLIEAMSCGVPSIASDIRGCNELIQTNQNGVLVKARDTKDIAGAINMLHKNSNLREKYGSKAREWIIQNNSIKSILIQTTREINALKVGIK